MSDKTKNVIMDSRSMDERIHDTLKSILWTLRLGFLTIILWIVYIYNGGSDLFFYPPDHPNTDSYNKIAP